MLIFASYNENFCFNDVKKVTFFIMFSFLFFLTIYNVTLDDISIGVWSGYEVILDRMGAACDTWVRQFKEVVVFSDFFPKHSKEILQEKANPTKLIFEELGDLSQHWFAGAWTRAQPRIIKGMETLYRRNTSKKWYFFCDDDSYPVMRNLIEALKDYSYEDSKVLGHFYCAWPEVVYGKNHDDECLDFAQGGAGVAVSQKYFSRIVDYLDGCNKKYSARLYAGSMRFAKCSHDVVGDKEWNVGHIVVKMLDSFNSCDPITEILNGGVLVPPVNFHKMTSKQVRMCHYGIRSDWYRKRDNQSMFVDWSAKAGSSYKFMFQPGKQELTYRLGYAIQASNDFGVIGRSTTPLVPIFADDMKEEPIGFTQQFADTAEVEIICNNTLEDGQYEQDRIENRDKMKIVFIMKCPPAEEYKWE